MRLTSSDRTAKAIKDHQSTEAISGALIQTEPFREVTDRKPINPADARAGRARVYVVTYNFPTLERGGKLRSGARIRFDLTDSEYPFTPPVVQAVDWAPWLPHVHGPTGMLCIGPSWQARRGRYLLGDLVVHTARILNAQEPSTKDAYDVGTIAYLKAHYGGGPINRGLVLPVVPPELTHGTIEVPRGAFTLARRGPQNVTAASPPVTFRRVSSKVGT